MKAVHPALVHCLPTVNDIHPSSISTTATTFDHWTVTTSTVQDTTCGILYSLQDIDDKTVRRNIFRQELADIMSEEGLIIGDGEPAKITLPDGTEISVAADGSFEISDANAKVFYRACRIRDFNPFLNASDKLEEFIKFCGAQGVLQGEVLHLPINLFIGWLIIEAARADQEPEPDIKLIPDLRRRRSPQCLACGRFITRRAAAVGIAHCGPPCLERHYQRLAA